MEATLDQFGRIVIPKKVREDFNLEPGAQIRIEKSDEAILLKPILGEPNIVEKSGVLVFSGKSIGNIEDALITHREDRIKGFNKK